MTVLNLNTVAPGSIVDIADSQLLAVAFQPGVDVGLIMSSFNRTGEHLIFLYFLFIAEFGDF